MIGSRYCLDVCGAVAPAGLARILPVRTDSARLAVRAPSDIVHLTGWTVPMVSEGPAHGLENQLRVRPCRCVYKRLPAVLHRNPLQRSCNVT